MTNKTNTFPKLTPAQERAWQHIQAWYAQPDHAETFYSGRAKRNITIHAVPVGKNTLEALWNKGMLKHAERKPWQPLLYTIHPDYIPTAPAPEPAPAAAPAPVNNAPVEPEAKFKVGDKVRVVDQDDYHTGETGEIIEIDGEYYHIEFLRGGSWNAMWYIESEFVIASEPQPAPEPTPLTGERREAFDALVASYEARIKELETENADLRGDMERLAASELELVQQNTLLNSVVDRLCQCATMVETAAQNAVEAYGKQDAEYTMRVLAHLVGIEWN